MTGDQQGRDPVEEFFAVHRDQVREGSADDLAWQRITAGHRPARSQRRRAWGGGLVAAAAALALVAGPSLLPDAETPNVAGPSPSVTGPVPSPSEDHTSDSSPTGESTSDDTTTGPTEQQRVVTTTVPEGQLPSDGRVTDVTTATPERTVDTRVRYATVTHPCSSQGWCTVLADSADGGMTWVPRADLTELGMVQRVLFTDAQRGWVWGDKAPLWTTTDGGTTWTEIPIEGDAVEDVAVHGGALLAVSTTYDPQACDSGDCPAGVRQVVLTDPTDTDWRDDSGESLGAVEEAEIVGTADVLYVVARQSVDGPVTQVLRPQEGRLETTAALTECGPGPAAVAAAGLPGSSGAGWETGLYALCDDDRGLALQSSPNGGRTWSPDNVVIPSFLLGERAPLVASASTGHLLVVGEGNYAVTTDTGQSWTPEAFLPGAASRPERLEVTAFGEVLAYPTDQQASADLAYWRSFDQGRTWEIVPLVG